MKRAILTVLVVALGGFACTHHASLRAAPPRTSRPQALGALQELGRKFAQPRASLEALVSAEVVGALPPLSSTADPAVLLQLARAARAASLDEDDPAISLQLSLSACVLAERASMGNQSVAEEASAYLASLLFSLQRAGLVAQALDATAATMPSGKVSRNFATLPQAFGEAVPGQLGFHLGRVLQSHPDGAALASGIRVLLASVHLPAPTTAMVVREYRRLRPTPDASELVLLAGSVARSDRPQYLELLAKAESAVAKLARVEQRSLLGTLADARREAALAATLAAAKGPALGDHLARFDAFFAQRDFDGCAVEAKILGALAPGDGRARVRLAQLAMAQGALRGVFAAVREGERVFAAVPLTAPRPEAERFQLGLAAASWLQGATHDPTGLAASSVEGAEPLLAAVERYRLLDPAGAAGLAFGAASFRAARGDKDRLLSRENAIRSFDEIVRLRRAHPDNEDVIQLALSVSTWVTPAVRGVELARNRAGIDPVSQPALACQHAAALLTLAAVTGDGALTLDARTSLEPIPASSDNELEGTRTGLLADAAVLDALAGDPARWGEAAAMYARAARQLPAEELRFRNNRAYALGKAGADAARVDKAYELALRADDTTPRSIAWLNARLRRDSPAAIYREVEPSLRGIAANDLSVASAFLLRWIAAHAPTRAEAVRHAAALRALSPMAYSPAPKAGWPLVCQSDRAVALGLAPDYSGYQFQFRGRCKLWLLDGGLPPTTTRGDACAEHRTIHRRRARASGDSSAVHDGTRIRKILHTLRGRIDPAAAFLVELAELRGARLD